jgi:hypothetical protein
VKSSAEEENVEESAFPAADEEINQHSRDDDDYQYLTLTEEHCQHCDFVSCVIRHKSGWALPSKRFFWQSFHSRFL